MGGNPALCNDLTQHFLGVVKEGLRMAAHQFVAEDSGVLAVQVPSLKEGGPVNVGNEVFERIVAQGEHSILGGWRGLGRKIRAVAKGPGLVD